MLHTWIISAILTASFMLLIYSNWNYNTSWERHHHRHHHHQHSPCTGKYVYMHTLPQDFNDLIIQRACAHNLQTHISWMCDYLRNHGYGLPVRASNSSAMLDPAHFPVQARPLISSCKLFPSSAWYRTGQFSLELMFHERMQRYPCLTDDPEAARVFYIPYYAGLDVSQYLFTKQVQLRDKLPQRLLGFLQGNPYWNRRGGRDHVLVLGRIVWDFGRQEEQVDDWGSSLLSLDEIGNLTKVLIERNSWSPSQIAAPYPTGFHPSSEEELAEWIKVVCESQRDWLVSFAGALRKGNSSTAIVRRALRRQCEESVEQCTVIECEKLGCELNPEVVNCAGLRSVFCLMPPGDSPTRKGFFDSIVSGCIPVVFTENTAYTQYLWHLPPNRSSYSVFFPENAVVNGGINVIQELGRISPDEIFSMQREIREIIRRVIYTNFSRSGDAFDIILQNLLSQQETFSLHDLNI